MSSPALAGRYRLQEVLSRTAMAEVRAGLDTELDRRVVVKLLAPAADRPRFEREARAAAALAHTNIVQLFDYGEEEGRPYMVFEYLPGGSLEECLAEDPVLPDSDVERIARDIAAGLAHAHERGVVHRDLKPGNVLFDAEGRAKIADFGIAQLSGADTLTDAGTVLGTAAYISPEQVRGEAATAMSDVYSFGVVLYRVLAGRLPFEAENPTELAAMHRDAEPPPLRTIRPSVPAALADLAMTALAKEPASRPRDGASLVELLTPDPPPRVVPDAVTRVIPPRSPRRGSRRRVRLLAGFSIVLLAALGAAAAVLLTSRDASAPAGSPKTSPSRSTTRASTAHTSSKSSSTATTGSSKTATTEPSTTARTPTGGTTAIIAPPPPPTISDTTPTTSETTTTAP